MAAKVFNVTDKLNTPVEEAYRVLRTNIQFSSFDKKLKTLAITSCYPSEGKTTTSMNLAISMAKTGSKVLLVDADLHKPMILKHLGGSNVAGLSNLISGRATLEEVVNKTTVEGLFFIACGPKPPNPAEMVGSNRFKEFLNTVSEQYDIVIVDTPPLGSVIDCALIAAITDGTLLVVASKAVEYKVVQRVKEQLVKANANIIGVVLNKVVKSDYKNYYNYYNYYGSTKSKEKSWFQKLMKWKKTKK